MIGGNAIGYLQRRTTTANALGEQVETWAEVMALRGWLDLSTGDSNRLAHNAKTQESTHIFMADYQRIEANATESRLVVDDQIYDVLLIDDPMGMHRHLEIYLKYVGV